MTIEPELEIKLHLLVQGIIPEGRSQTEALIASVVAGGGTSERALIELARDLQQSTRLRADACWLISRLGSSAAADVLEALLSDPAESVRAEAVAGLGSLMHVDSLDALLQIAERDGSQAVRLAALHALGLLSEPASAAPLIALLRNAGEDADVRANAAEALAHIHDDQIVDGLIEALSADSPLVRYSAAYALGEQGEARALPALRTLAAQDQTSTPWGPVSTRALDAIEAIVARQSD